MSDEPDLSEFDDWSVESFGPISDGDENPLNDRQKAIVARNVELLMDRDKWTKKVARFQTLVEQQPDDDTKKAFLKRFSIHFNSAKFDNADGSISFSGILFPVEADFGCAEFSGGDATFDNAKFSGGDAYFVGAKFKGGDATFDYAAFIGVDAYFINAEFSGGGASFRNAEFSGSNAIFSCAEFEGVFSLSTIQCKGLDFSGATFHSLSTFIVTQCHSLPDFRHTKFDRPPNLSQLVINERTQFDLFTLDFPHMFDRPRNFHKRSIKDRTLLRLFTLNFDQSIVDKWRVLKQLAQDSGDDEKAGRFFANEMAAKRGTEITGFVPLFVSWLYMTFSNFGQCYVRPFWGLLGLWGSFGVGYYLSLPKQFEGLSGALIAAQLSLQNSLPFISSIGRFAAQPNTDGYVSWFQQQINTISDIHGGFDHFLIPSIIQQAIGAILLFLLILGLRNVFRMK